MKFITTFLQRDPFSVIKGELQFSEEILSLKKAIPDEPKPEEIGVEEDLSLWHEEVEITELEEEEDNYQIQDLLFEDKKESLKLSENSAICDSSGLQSANPIDTIK